MRYILSTPRSIKVVLNTATLLLREQSAAVGSTDLSVKHVQEVSRHPVMVKALVLMVSTVTGRVAAKRASRGSPVISVPTPTNTERNVTRTAAVSMVFAITAQAVRVRVEGALAWRVTLETTVIRRLRPVTLMVYLNTAMSTPSASSPAATPRVSVCRGMKEMDTPASWSTPA